MSAPPLADFGVLGLGVMGQNLALNFADHGVRVAVYNRSPAPRQALLAAHPDKGLLGAESLPDFVGSLARPRRVLCMVKAGQAMDDTLDALVPLLDAGDIVIDGGNAWFQDTQRREESCKALGLRYFGMGVSGGEEGARFGPSLMPGGDPAAFALMQPMLEAIAAKTEAGPCVAWCGPDGAGHFVKMVHNGIEYADMQLLAEAYALLAAEGLDAAALAEVFTAWNQGPLASFLVEITAKIFTVQDPETGRPLVDLVLDQAGQKGTGRWTAAIALELGVSVPSIAAAVDARVVSSQRSARLANAAALCGPSPAPSADRAARISAVHDALLASRVCAYAQGMQLIAAAAARYGWGTDQGEMARIWKGGCIIRARLLDRIRAAFGASPALENLLLDPDLGGAVVAAQGAWREVVASAIHGGVATPVMSAGLAWFDGVRAARGPQNLTQAQRDAFGAHTYQRTDRPEAGFVHTDWLQTGG